MELVTILAEDTAAAVVLMNAYALLPDADQNRLLQLGEPGKFNAREAAVVCA